MRILPALFTMSGLLAAMGASAGDYYKWTDAQGTVHYSQSPPPGQAAKTVYVNDNTPTPPPPGLNDDSRGEQKRARENRNALQKANAQAVSANCTTAERNAANLKSRRMVARLDNNPDMRALTPEERKQALADAREQADTYCTKEP